MKKKQRIKKRITTLLLVVALVIVQVMQVTALAAETDPGAAPSVVCSNYSSLYQAFIQANDGDVIGIDNIIDVQVNGGTFGSSDKHVTIVKMNDGAMFQVGANSPFTFKNITLDGGGITSYNSMVNVGWNVNFEDVTFQNAECVFDGNGGAITIMNGTVNFTGCSFLNNSSVSGGHLLIQNDSQVSITGCTFEGGTAAKGGSINQDGSSSYVTINSTTIKGNDASESGGGIFSQGRMVIEDSKVYDNTAPLGEDITCTVLGNVQVQDDVDALQQTFSDENITVNGWILTIDENNASKYRKLDYEVITEPDPGDDEETPDPGEGGNGDQDDSGDQGNTDAGGDSGNTGGIDEGNGGDQGNTDPGTPSDPGDSGSGTDEGNNDQGDDSGTGGSTDSGDTQQPGTDGGSDTGGTDAGGNTDNSDHSTTDNSSSDSSTNDNSNHTDNSSQDSTDNSSHDTITDSSDHSTTTTNTSTDNSQTTSNSGNTTSTSTTDSSNNSRTDNSRTESSDNHSTTTTTTNNYYQSSQTPVQQNQGQTPVQQSQQPVIINNYIEPSQDGQKASQGQQVDSSSPSSGSPSNDPSNNIRIDAKGVDVTFEVVDGVYSISINAQQAAEPAPASIQTVTEASDQKTSVNWYEIIKIVLLAAIGVNLMWKPRKKTTA